jgi:HAMP domain-containing protein
MTLSNRLTVYFLAALAVVLAAFSVALYMLAHAHLSKQLDERVATTMDTLIALAEIEPDGLDWEPELRRLPAHWEGDPPAWAIYDENGARVDGSHDPHQRLSDFAAHGSDSTRERHQVQWNGNDWRVARQTLVFPDSSAIRSRPGHERHQILVFVTAWPVNPVQTALRTLAWSLAGISMAIWLIAGLISRWLCRRALAPVTRMTEAVKGITADDLDERLPVPAARDELHDLASRFNELLARLQDSLERQRRFTGEASHQLQTPLTAMLGQMEVALRRERDPDEYRRVLNSAVAQAGATEDGSRDPGFDSEDRPRQRLGLHPRSRRVEEARHHRFPFDRGRHPEGTRPRSRPQNAARARGATSSSGIRKRCGPAISSPRKSGRSAGWSMCSCSSSSISARGGFT